MSDQRFDLTYKGLVAPGADPETTRQRLTGVFKLSDKGAERLFTGRPVVVQRDVDAATAARFKKIFAHAGAVLTITPVAGLGTTDNKGPAAAPRPQADDSREGAPLSLAPQWGDLESPSAAAPPVLDLSYLSLVPGDNWTLEDCEAPPTPIPELDTSALQLEPLQPRTEHTTDPLLD
ncbi:hypothetical protein [Candidatus Thiodictyon syntrophicum]|jgi:hypothetical protein|uniref:Uncharacterized protein n=1 Tax=Candidatus Thiodictyon syntrophicum TaxID=1166950 RepID=A0A2K8U443_9GAMM|nr:hypothetical protein [Candidatus Thiodictyon syntrophicum]AUB80169.1 hypothetical protein THSYN_03795 [Candidatus Thiodictyon syntrophicum]